MKQLHKQMSSKRDDDTIPMSQSSPYSPKALKHPRSLPRSLHYLFREQRLLFILVGILIGSTFFILQPSLSRLAPAESTSLITRSVVDSNNYSPSKMSFNYGGGKTTGRVPVGIGGRRLRIVVTGGAGFVGSHLVDKLIGRGDEVIVIDNFFTGRKENLVHLFSNPRFELIRHDVVEPILLEVDQIYHLACPASPVHYKFNPVKTIKTNVMGTLNMLGLAKRVGARFLLTSTSEVYGDPLEHPQKETYWGNVNPIGERSCYDEGKRTAETLAMDYHRGAGVEVRIARIFNTYGPRMCLDDGRVVSNFVAQAIRKNPMTVYGDGKQTRSFQYVSDLVDGLVALMEHDHVGPFNLGNPGEFTMLELAEVCFTFTVVLYLQFGIIIYKKHSVLCMKRVQVVKEVIDPSATIEFKPNTADDPHKRKPDISKAKELLNWEPKISLRDGLPRMVSDFRNRILNEDEGKGL
ncbi:UDP-glucuronic acid decarboxylase 1-like isoform X1 [Brassica napus]|uniref:UDP-glucuronic acid decarboxylase 1-like isoform X1 n=1 Tax=Brassica oleracea var. oleracea TaxID=109376 RepID=UPI0006A6C63D|nr:PREDICTED: UDP-glucuronic acid decarboxylase 1-like isoform X1 [Brassica oleracea var. oleracea]XP_013737884.1 UDP-glucuronic acid decarboxylase 1-like isoform X1 [Brassica napus]